MLFRSKTGSFTGDFENQAAGKTNTTNFINEGADIIMPVAGPVGLGTLDAAEAQGSAAIQVDGQMVDYPVVHRARAVLAAAREIAARRS